MRTIIRRATGEQIRVTDREFQIMFNSGEITVNGLSTYVLIRENSERVFDPFGEPVNSSTSTAVKKEPKKFSKEFDNLLDSYIHFSKTISTNPLLRLAVNKEGFYIQLISKNPTTSAIVKKDNSYVIAKVINRYTNHSPDYLDNIKKTCFVKVISCKESAEVFGYNTLKKNMLSSGANYTITNILPSFTCAKDSVIRDVVEVNYEGRNFKFVLKDLEFIYPNTDMLLKGYIAPKNRTISTDSIVKLKDNRRTNLPKNTTFKVAAINRVTTASKISKAREYCKIVHNNKEYFILKNKFKVI